MVVRFFLACWMFLTSALGPALCCCVPAFATPSSPDKPTATPSLVTSTGRCPLCHPTGSTQPADPKSPGKCPCGPTSPGQKDCPCRNHHLTPVITEAAGVRLSVAAVWSLVLTPLVAFAVEHPLTAPASPRTAHTGPPPLAGVELLHRLHVLVC